MATSVFSDENLAAIQVLIPDYARNQTARIVKESTMLKQPLTFYKSRCGKTFLNLSSLVLSSKMFKLQVGKNQNNLESCVSKINKTVGIRKPLKTIVSSKFKCISCSLWFTERYQYNDHVACHKNPLLKCCEICKTKFTSGIRARRHIAKFHPVLHQKTEAEYKLIKASNQVQGRKCKRENKINKSPSNVEQDNEKLLVISNLIQDKYLNTRTLDTSNSINNLSSALNFRTRKKSISLKQGKNQQQTNIIQQQCPICLKLCLSNNLKTHIISHNRYSNQTVCFLCDQDLKHNLKLKNHFRSIHKENWYQYIRQKTKTAVKDKKINNLFYCEICFLPLEDETQREMHIIIAHARKQCSKSSAECRVCHKLFYSSVNRRIHEQRFHRNVTLPSSPNDFICDLCGASYSHKGHLNLHMKRHATSVSEYSEATKKRYGLKIDDTKKSTKVNKQCYKMHFIRQEDNKIEIRFLCLACNEYFPNVERVKSHLKEEHPRKAKKYICELCGVTFTEKYNLKGHLVSFHGQVATLENERKEK